MSLLRQGRPDILKFRTRQDYNIWCSTLIRNIHTDGDWTDFVSPSMIINQIANLPFQGQLGHLRHAIENSEANPQTWGSNTMGDIRVVFQVVLDASHSDVMSWHERNNSKLDAWGKAVLFATMMFIVSTSMYHWGVEEDILYSLRGSWLHEYIYQAAKGNKRAE